MIGIVDVMVSDMGRGPLRKVSDGMVDVDNVVVVVGDDYYYNVGVDNYYYYY